MQWPRTGCTSDRGACPGWGVACVWPDLGERWGMQVWKLGLEGAALGCVGTGGTGAGLEASKEAILAFCCVTPCPAVRSHGLPAKPHCRCSCVPLSSAPPPHPHFPQPPAAPDASAQAKIEELQADNAKLEGDLRDLQAKLAQVPPPTDAGVHCVSRCADCTVLCRAFA